MVTGEHPLLQQLYVLVAFGLRCISVCASLVPTDSSISVDNVRMCLKSVPSAAETLNHWENSISGTG